MASCAAGSQATEIDFESWSGQEMLDYLAYQVTDLQKGTGRFVLEYEGTRYACCCRDLKINTNWIWPLPMPKMLPVVPE